MTSRLWIPVVLALIPAACGDADTGDSAPESTSPQAVAESPTLASLASTPPDTTVDGVWGHLTEADYQENWNLWPDKGELYTGTEPHGMLLTTYLNESAARALDARLGAMPLGAILVKENYMPDSTLAAVTVMVKQREGYNPDHNDWWFLKRNADGSIDAAGRGQGCQDCHGGAAQNDYVFTGSLGG